VIFLWSSQHRTQTQTHTVYSTIGNVIWIKEVFLSISLSGTFMLNLS
jgi:hypothetical protein